MSVISTYIIEIPLTYLFFAPTQGLRKFTWVAQVTFYGFHRFLASLNNIVPLEFLISGISDVYHNGNRKLQFFQLSIHRSLCVSHGRYMVKLS
jgi:hypothetical protein